VAIGTPRAGPIEIAALRSVDLVAALHVRFVAGAWVDRLWRVGRVDDTRRVTPG
jgi:hypothetical protein